MPTYIIGEQNDCLSCGIKNKLMLCAIYLGGGGFAGLNSLSQYLLVSDSAQMFECGGFSYMMASLFTEQSEVLVQHLSICLFISRLQPNASTDCIQGFPFLTPLNINI